MKPLAQIRLRHSVAHTQPRSPSLRSAFALIASAAAHDIELHGEVSIPRCLIFEDVEGVLENGVCRDILKAGMARLVTAPDPKDELFYLDAEQVVIF